MLTANHMTPLLASDFGHLSLFLWACPALVLSLLLGLAAVPARRPWLGGTCALVALAVAAIISHHTAVLDFEPDGGAGLRFAAALATGEGVLLLALVPLARSRTPRA